MCCIISFNFSNHFQHRLPKMSYVYFLTHKTVGWLTQMHKSAVSSASRFPYQFYLHYRISAYKVLWVHKIIDSAWIMGNRKIKILLLFVCLLEKSK